MPIEPILLAPAQRLCEDERFRRALWRYCRYTDDAQLADLNTLIHPADDMLGHSLRHHRNANFAVSQYFNVALQQHLAFQQIFRHAFPGDRKRRNVLDFASGYGRHLRFLTLPHPVSRIWAAEILADAVQFVTKQFGVNGLQSSVDPNEFRPSMRFDFIWVASLFSHLPESSFHAWLRTLGRLLTPDGVLCFSVHDEWEIPADESMPANGLLFRPVSETAALDVRAYGTSYVTETFVSRAIHESIPGSRWLRIRRGLANHQDLYVVWSEARPTLSAISFKRGAWGWVDVLRVSAAGEIDVAGWGASLDRVGLGQVTIRIDDDSYVCTTNVFREDVLQAVGAGESGFDFHASLRERKAVFLEVGIEGFPEEAALLYGGWVPELP